MRLGLNLGLTRGGGVIDPYSGYLYAADFSNPSGYALNTGAIETIYNLGSAGSADDSTQATASLRPAYASNFAVYDGVDDTHIIPNLHSLIQTLSFDATFSINPASFAATGVTLSADPSSGSGWLQVLVTTTARLRINARDTSNANIFQVDYGLTGPATAGMSTGTTYEWRLTISGGLLNLWVDGVQVATDTTFPTSGSFNATLAEFHLGKGRTGSPAFNGSIGHFYAKAI